MRRKEIIDAVTQIVSALESSKIIAVLRVTREQLGPKRSDPKMVTETLRVLRLYTLLAHSFSPPARELTRILGIDRIEDPALWSTIISEDPNHESISVWWDLKFAYEHLPKIAQLLEQHPLEGSDVNGTNVPDGMRVLTVMIFEPINTISSPIRLANVLEGINHFYTACALMGKESPSTLSVIACDSGSDKSFDFLGLAKVMECVERLITNIWDRVVFYREHQFEERLDLISKSLPILQQINKMEEHKELEPELAEILRRNVFDGTNKFVQSGATIPQFENSLISNPRQILSPVQKLLVSTSSEESETAEVCGLDRKETSNSESTEQISFDNLSGEEKEILRALFEKARKANTSAGEPAEKEKPKHETI